MGREVFQASSESDSHEGEPRRIRCRITDIRERKSNMEELDHKHSRCVPALRWIARAWSVASIVVIIAFFIGEGFDLAKITPKETLGLIFFPFGMCLGLIIAWWKEGLGGLVAVGSLLAFYAVHLATAGTFPSGWAWLVFAAPGFLFVFLWCLGTGPRGK